MTKKIIGGNMTKDALTEEERELLANFRALDGKGKRYVRIMVDVATEMQLERYNVIDFPKQG